MTRVASRVSFSGASRGPSLFWAGGAEVADRPVSIPDLFQSTCKALGINAAAEHLTNIGRPIKIVDGGKPVDELFG